MSKGAAESVRDSAKVPAERVASNSDATSYTTSKRPPAVRFADDPPHAPFRTRKPLRKSLHGRVFANGQPVNVNSNWKDLTENGIFEIYLDRFIVTIRGDWKAACSQRLMDEDSRLAWTITRETDAAGNLTFALFVRPAATNELYRNCFAIIQYDSTLKTINPEALKREIVMDICERTYGED
ncbi:hypothetical protein NCC49_004183 [Naganishia albida]|nr:hypothetical protein NCC49_004183 [Naganishia albida]